MSASANKVGCAGVRYRDGQADHGWVNFVGCIYGPYEYQEDVPFYQIHDPAKQVNPTDKLSELKDNRDCPKPLPPRIDHDKIAEICRNMTPPRKRCPVPPKIDVTKLCANMSQTPEHHPLPPGIPKINETHSCRNLNKNKPLPSNEPRRNQTRIHPKPTMKPRQHLVPLAISKNNQTLKNLKLVTEPHKLPMMKPKENLTQMNPKLREEPNDP